MLGEIRKQKQQDDEHLPSQRSLQHSTIRADGMFADEVKVQRMSTSSSSSEALRLPRHGEVEGEGSEAALKAELSPAEIGGMLGVCVDVGWILQEESMVEQSCSL